MSQRLHQGWSVTKRHVNIILLYFIYQAIWGFVLYRIIDHIVSPLLLRYPKITNSSEAMQLFWIETEFNLMKTDMIVPYIWSLAGLLLLRMMITPIIQSGMYYSLFEMSQGAERTAFRKGIAATWKPMMLVYWLKSIAILVPLVYLLRPLIFIQDPQAAFTSLLDQPGWLWIGFILWATMISLLSYMITLGIGAKLSPVQALLSTIKHTARVLIIGITLTCCYLLISLPIHTLSIVWVTFISFVLYQLLPLVRVVFKVWTISAQYNAMGNDLSQ